MTANVTVALCKMFTDFVKVKSVFNRNLESRSMHDHETSIKLEYSIATINWGILLSELDVGMGWPFLNP